MRSHLPLAGLLFALQIVFGGHFADARKKKPTFGGEIEFTNNAIKNARYEWPTYTMRLSDESAYMQDIFRDEVLRVCDGCTSHLLWDHDGVATYRITYPDGWWFQVSLDPYCIEVQTAPASVKKLKKLRNRIQTDIFDVAHRIGLQSGGRESGGHLHMGAQSAFDGDAKLFRNFIVDFVNHSELANGILVNDHSNAPPIQALTAEQRAGFARVIQDFDEGRIKTIWELVVGLETHVYYATTEEGWAPADKFQALNVRRIFEIFLYRTPDRTVEIRSIRGQTCADELILEAQLFEARLDYLRTLEGPLQIIWGPAMKDKQGLLDAYYRYVVESGLDWEEYKSLLPARFRTLEPTVVMVPLDEGAAQNRRAKGDAKRVVKRRRRPAADAPKVGSLPAVEPGSLVESKLQPIHEWMQNERDRGYPPIRRRGQFAESKILPGTHKMGCQAFLVR